MAEFEKLKSKLRRGSILSFRDVKKLLEYFGYEMKRKKGSHQQWVKDGRTFTLAIHGKEAPHYILDALRKLMEVSDGQEKN